MTTFTTQDRLEAMNNKPVAWTDGKGNYFDKNSFFPVDDLTPLYTHPVKELTDEEIEKVIVKNIVEILEKYADKLEDERPNKGFSDVVYESIEILKKAQEK